MKWNYSLGDIKKVRIFPSYINIEIEIDLISPNLQYCTESFRRPLYQYLWSKAIHQKSPVLGAYDGTQPDIELMLPPNIQVSDLKWISIWCREFSISFGEFIIKGYQNSIAPELGEYLLAYSDNLQNKNSRQSLIHSKN